MNTKTCNKCGEIKPLEEFHYSDKPNNKRRARCKICEGQKPSIPAGMKCCYACEEIKSLEEFSWRSKIKNLRSSKCKSCRTTKKSSEPKRYVAGGTQCCYKCGENKSMDDFYSSGKALKDGSIPLKSECKSCYLNYRRDLRAGKIKSPDPRSCVVCELIFNPPKGWDDKIVCSKKCSNRLWSQSDEGKEKRDIYYHSDRAKFNHGKGAAKKRNKEWSLTFEEYVIIISEPCYYCANKLYSPVISACGLDRLDDTIGYITGNVVSCCEMCNKVRNTFMTPEEMKKVAALLIKLRNL